MKTIWKFPFQIKDSFQIGMPIDAEILSVQMQHGNPTIWALVNPDADKEVRQFSVVGTGHDTNQVVGNYIGTFQMLNGDLVWHLFEN